jgi:hypothetical protein
MERMLTVMTTMQQHFDAQLKLFAARLSALESGAAGRTSPVSQVAKKRRSSQKAPAPSPSREEDGNPESDGEDDSKDERADGAQPADPMAAVTTVSPTKNGNNKRSHYEGEDATFLQPVESSTGDQ